MRFYLEATEIFLINTKKKKIQVTKSTDWENMYSHPRSKKRDLTLDYILYSLNARDFTFWGQLKFSDRAIFFFF